MAKDSLNEREIHQFLDIFEIIKKFKVNEADTRLVKNLSTIIYSLTNRYQKYLDNISSQIKEPFIEEKQKIKSIPSQNKQIYWNERLKEIKRAHPRAYLSWNEGEEKQLVQLLRDGLQPSGISKKLERQPGAIRSRLRRLKLIE